jgi:hypothetical protein
MTRFVDPECIQFERRAHFRQLETSWTNGCAEWRVCDGQRKPVP